MSVRVIARIRPLLKNERAADIVVTPDSTPTTSNNNNNGARKQKKHSLLDDCNDTSAYNLIRMPNPKKRHELYSFQFNGVYDAQVSQLELFNAEVAPTVTHLFAGFDVTIFAYGVTGTGKTHTMRGGTAPAERGIIPRLLNGIYRHSRRMEQEDETGQTSVTVSMSYYEIYNDKVHDLFEPPEKRSAFGLALRDVGGKTHVVGLTERPCESLQEFELLYDQGNANRSTGATKLNAHSSRSHAILCVKVSVTTGDQTRVSVASAIDLAGSEDNRRTDNVNQRMVESTSINKSLFVLAQCVEAIGKKQHRIPYRESKMTRILCLGQNNGLTLMILNLAPIKAYQLDTLSSLNFANRTKKIETKEVENEVVSKPLPPPPPPPSRQPLRSLPPAPGRKASAPVMANSSAPLNKANGGFNFGFENTSPPDEERRKPSTMSRAKSRERHATPPSAIPTAATSASEIPTPSKTSLGYARPIRRRSKIPRSDTGSSADADTSVIGSDNMDSESQMHQTPSSSFLSDTRLTTPSPVSMTSIASSGVSAQMIEDLVERKVQAVLAASKHYHQEHQLQPQILPQPNIQHAPEDADLKRRLEILEERLAGKEDIRAEGLSYLLMAKQHQARGEDAFAMRMYQLASLFFPDNNKLKDKMAELRAALGPAKAPPPVPRVSQLYDFDLGVGAEDENYVDGRNAAARAAQAQAQAQAQARQQQHYMASPTAAPQVMSVNNTRNVSQIQLLHGLSPRTAEAIVDGLCESDVDDLRMPGETG